MEFGELKHRMVKAGVIVAETAKKTVTSKEALSVAASVGLWQGLKYQGDIKRGVKGAAAALGTNFVLNSIVNIANNWDYINS